MDTIITNVTSKGQMTLPVAFRRKMGVDAPGRVRVSMRGSNLIVQKDNWRAEMDKVHEMVAAHLKKNKIKPLTDKQLDDLINESAMLGATEHHLHSLAS